MHVSYSKNLKILLNDFKCWYALDCISFDKAIEVDNGMFKSENNELDVIGWGSCMGFILLSFKKRQHHGVFYVWNPCTGEYIKLPDLGFPAHSYALSVYYNSSVGNYEFVVMAYGESNILPECKSYADICSLATSGSWGKIKSYADIYSLATGSWRKIESIPYKIPKWGHGILVDGFLHWIAAHESSESVKSDFVIAFDICGDKFQEVPLPNGMNPSCFLDITELGGELCLVCNYKIRVEAWLMKDYGVKSSWTKLFNIKQSPGVYFRSLIPLCFTKDGILILHMDGTMLVQYHPIVGGLFLLKIKGIPEEWFEPIMYYESQVVINQGETNERVLDLV